MTTFTSKFAAAFSAVLFTAMTFAATVTVPGTAIMPMLA